MTDFKSIIEQAATAANHAPSELREATYKVVLEFLLRSEVVPIGKRSGKGESASVADGELLSKLDIAQDDWFRVFDEDDSGVHVVVRKIPGRGNSEQQVNLALLLAMKLWKQHGQVTTFTGKDLAALCKDHGCWDTNVATNIKKSGHFRKEGSAYKLIKRGEEAAIALVKQLGSEQSSG